MKEICPGRKFLTVALIATGLLIVTMCSAAYAQEGKGLRATTLWPSSTPAPRKKASWSFGAPPMPSSIRRRRRY